MDITYIILIFSVLGALDKILGNRFGLGAEFEKAFQLLGAMALSMIGMIIISPFIAELMKPVSSFMTEVLNIDASIIPASLFANDMGGAPLAKEMASDNAIGMMDKMDKKGVTLNSAFAVSGAFVIGGHMAFTMAFDGSYIVPVIVGKLVAGILAVVLANVIYDRNGAQPEFLQVC